MNKYEFRHSRKELALLLSLSSVFLIMQTTDIGGIWHSFFLSIGGDDAYVVASTVLFFAAAIVAPVLIGSNAKGYGILHRDYVEINLGFGTKVREIEYSRIKNIEQTFGVNTSGWLIEIERGRNIRIFSTMRTKELERFMKDLKQKLPKSSKRR